MSEDSINNEENKQQNNNENEQSDYKNTSNNYLNEIEEKRFKELYIQGYSRNQITKILKKEYGLRISKSNAQEIFKSYNNSPLFNEHKLAIKLKGRNKSKPITENLYYQITEDYRKGMTLDEIRDKYHIDRTTLYNEIKPKIITEQIEKEHEFYLSNKLKKENIESKIIKNQKISILEFFGRDIKHLNYSIYCALPLKITIPMYENYPISNEMIEEGKRYHKTSYITKGIKSKSDMETFYKLFLENSDKLKDNPFCVDFSTNNKIDFKYLLKKFGISTLEGY